MTWFKLDGTVSRHQKVRRAGRDGRALWYAAGPECGEQRTDGVVSPLLLVDAAHLAELSKAATARAVAALVESGLWHDSETIKGCRSCTVHLQPGDHYFHDWLDYQPSREDTELPEARLRVRRKRQLTRDRALCDAIWERDRGLCRYCATRVNSADRRGAKGATYDHVDPAGPNSMGNVVLACRTCNGRKRDRTPDEAGMVLLPEPEPYDPARTRSEPDPGQVPGRSDLMFPSRDARDGPDQIGAGSGPGPGQIEPEQDEPGTGRPDGGGS